MRCNHNTTKINDDVKLFEYAPITDWCSYLGKELAEEVFADEPDDIRIRYGFPPKNQTD